MTSVMLLKNVNTDYILGYTMAKGKGYLLMTARIVSDLADIASVAAALVSRKQTLLSALWKID